MLPGCYDYVCYCKSYLEGKSSEIFLTGSGYTICEVMMMSYVAPALQEKFETLSVDLKNAILERNVQLYTLQDLIKCLEDIVNEAEG